MHSSNPVSDFLEGKGYADHVVQGGLKGLVENWEKIVSSVEQGYTLGLADYLNDLDGRQILEEALAVAPALEKEKYLERVYQADSRMRTLLKPAGKCLWGDRLARKEGWTMIKNWWYFFRPLRANPELLAEIDGLQID